MRLELVPPLDDCMTDDLGCVITKLLSSMSHFKLKTIAKSLRARNARRARISDLQLLYELVNEQII